MKKVYITRNDLFKGIDMILLNNICEIDDSFIDDNMEVFYTYPGDEEVDEKIEDLAGIDWSKEDYKPYDITDKMSPDEIKKHLQAFRDDILIDLEPDFCEPYQYFLIDANDWKIEELKEYGIELGFSEKLQHHILPIYDYGTSWSHFSYSKEVDDDYTPAHDETLERKTVY